MKNNIKYILNNIEENIKKYSSKEKNIKLIIVTKSQTIDDIKILINLGYKSFGENYLNEAKSKILTLSNEDIEWHFIGKIQSNKVKDIVKHFSFIQTIASKKHAEIIDFECKKQNKIMNACIQINIDREDSKAGILSDELDEFLSNMANLVNIRIRGIMAIPSKENIARGDLKSYKIMRDLYNKFSKKYDYFDTLSLGMSNDYIDALENGSNMIRIGSMIFGERNS